MDTNKVVKEIKLSLIMNDSTDKPHAEWKITQTDYDGVELTPDMFQDGSRFIIMNNANQILVGRYNCIAAFNAYKDSGIEMEKVIFEKMREELGFKKQF